MLSKMLVAAGVAVVVALGAYFYTQQDGNADNAGGDAAALLRSHIPADSIAFAFSQKAMPIDVLVNKDPSIEQVAQALDKIKKEGTSPAAQFWANLGTSYIRALQQGPAALKSEWGFGDEVHSALYFVGLSPILELSVVDPAKMRDQLRTAATAAGLEMATTSDNGASEHRVDFYEQDGQALTLLLRETESWVRIALVLPSSEANAPVIAGAALPQKSLADTDLLDRMNQQFEVSGDMVAATNFVALAAALTDPASMAGDTISKLLPELDLSQWQDASCQQELTAIAAAVPEWLLVTDFSVGKSGEQRTLTSHSETLLRINSEWLNTSLTKLNGVLPDFSKAENFEPLYSVGLGLDVAQLAPVLMELHQAVAQQTYKCGYLQTVQAQLRDANPAMLGMATAMVSGIRGASVTLNEVALGDSMMEVESASALISLSATSVRQILALVQGFIPDLAQLQIPEDGSPVPLQSIMLPEQLPPLQVAIKDDHHLLVMTEDDLAQRLAASFSGLGIDGKGFLSVAMDLGKLQSVLGGALEEGLPGMQAMSPEDCADMALMRESYESLQVSLGGDMRFSAKGLHGSGHATQVLAQAEVFELQPGTYDAFYVGQGCEAELDGRETFEPGGQGTMATVLSEPGCEGVNYEANFNWEQRGLALHYRFKQEREREECGAALPEWSEVAEAGTNKSCIIVDASEDSFQCVFTGNEDGAYSYIFKRQQNN